MHLKDVVLAVGDDSEDIKTDIAGVHIEHKAVGELGSIARGDGHLVGCASEVGDDELPVGFVGGGSGSAGDIEGTTDSYDANIPFFLVGYRYESLSGTPIYKFDAEYVRFR